MTVAELAGVWAGTLTHAGETEPFALELEPGADGKVLLRMSVPVAHLDRAPLGRVAAEIQGREVRLGPFVLRYDREAKTLSGVAPKDLVPLYEIPLTLRRVERFDVPPRPAITAPLVTPVWTFEAGSPLWAGATFADGTVYVGGQDGQLHALDARTGRKRWSFRAGGPIRTRATVAGADVYFQADDGYLYRLAAASGEERWRVRVVEKPIERLPFDNPKSRYDRFGSDVTVAGGRLYLGTHDGRVLAVDPARGERLWEFASGDSVLAAPAVADGRVVFGSFDGHVYALEASTGKLLWKRDTRGAVVSTPAVVGDRVVVGNRSYDLLGLDARTGEPAWTRYIWFSWVESSAAVARRRRLRRLVRRRRRLRVRRADRRAALEDRRLRMGLGPARGHRRPRLRGHRQPEGLPGRPQGPRRGAWTGRPAAPSGTTWPSRRRPARTASPARRRWGRGSCS